MGYVNRFIDGNKGVLLHPLVMFAATSFHGQFLKFALLERVLFNQLFMAPCIYYPIYFSIFFRRFGSS